MKVLIGEVAEVQNLGEEQIHRNCVADMVEVGAIVVVEQE